MNNNYKKQINYSKLKIYNFINIKMKFNKILEQNNTHRCIRTTDCAC